MKPSVILYKTLPDDLLQRLQEHFTEHRRFAEKIYKTS